MTDRAPLHARGPFERYRAELALGTHWYLAALRAAALWTLRAEIVRQRRLVYLIDGQALDLLLVIERLVTAGGGAKRDELDRLLFAGEPPIQLTEAEFRNALGPESYSAYLTYFYGVTVEEALTLELAQITRRVLTHFGGSFGNGAGDEIDGPVPYFKWTPNGHVLIDE